MELNIPLGIGGWELVPHDAKLQNKLNRISYRERRLSRMDTDVRNGLSNLALFQSRIETKVAARDVDLNNQMVAMMHAQEANARSLQNTKAIKRLQPQVAALKRRARKA